MARQVDWFPILSNFIRRHPKTSAVVAFNLGLLAAQTAKRGKAAAPNMTEIRDKLIDLAPSAKDLIALVPSVKDLASYVPALAAAKDKPVRRKSRKPPRRRTVRKAAKTARRKKAA